MPKGRVFVNGQPAPLPVTQLVKEGEVVEESEEGKALEAPPQEECKVIGCIAHGMREVKVGEDKFSPFVHFQTQEQILERAMESVGRLVQSRIRKNRKENEAEDFPQERMFNIYPSLKIARTPDDLANEIEAMSAEEKDRQYKALLAHIELLKKSMSVAHSS